MWKAGYDLFPAHGFNYYYYDYYILVKSFSKHVSTFMRFYGVNSKR